jgi:hypothetical protein
MLVLVIGWCISHIHTNFASAVADVVTQFAALPMVFAAGGWIWWVGLVFYTRWRATVRWIEKRAPLEERLPVEEHVED